MLSEMYKSNGGTIMKIKLTALLLALVLLLSSLASCAGGVGDDTGDGDSSGETTDTPETGDGEEEAVAAVPTSIVHAALLPDSVDMRAVINRCQAAFGKRLSTHTDEEAATGAELAVGNTSRAVSVKAMKYLSRYVRREAKDEWSIVNYALVVSGGSIAIVWEDERAAAYAMDYLLETLAERPEELVDGLCELVSYDIYPEMKAEEDKQKQNYLKAVGDKFGEGTMNAVGEYLDQFDEEFYIWLANLYEPRTCICDNYDEKGYRTCLLPKDEDGNYLCHGGGFYYSNSARNTPGFDIDIESTAQVLSFLSESGMIKYYGSLKNAIPQQMQNDIVAYAKSLQDPKTGYFYHPQWGSDISDSRLGRDLGWAIDVLGYFGHIPLYDTPNGVSGSLGAPSGVLTSPLEADTATLVSKVNLAASYSSHLQTLDAFNEYLKTFDLKTKSYSAGNKLTSQFSLMRQRDREGIASGEFTDADGDGIAEDGIYMTCINFFINNVNPENGLWEDEVHYDSVNALMKIGASLHSGGFKIPYADKALESAITMALWNPEEPDVKGKRPTNFVDVFNPWVCINKVKQNINKFGTADERAKFNTYLKDNAEILVRTTIEKAKKFEKIDGSYGYTWTSSPTTSQGVPVSVPGSIEGDVNGGLMIKGAWTNLATALGIDAQLYYRSDYERFIDCVMGLEPVIKIIPDDTERPVIDFEEYDVGEEMPDRVSCTTYDGGMSVIVDPKNSNNKVIRFYHTPSDTGATRLYVTPVGSLNPTCHVLEWDMYVESAKATSTALQIRLSGYMFTMGFTNGKVKLGDASSTSSKVSIYNSFGTPVNMGEWHNIRLEFYTNIGDGTCRTKIYVDNVLIAISDNFVGKEAEGATHTSDFTVATFYTLIASEESMLLDNIHCFKENLVYTEEDIGTIREDK